MAKARGSGITADGTASTKTYTEKQVFIIAGGVAILSALATLMIITSPDVPDWKQVLDHLCDTYSASGSVYYAVEGVEGGVYLSCKRPAEFTAEDILLIPSEEVGEFDYGIR